MVRVSGSYVMMPVDCLLRLIPHALLSMLVWCPQCHSQESSESILQLEAILPEKFRTAIEYIGKKEFGDAENMLRAIRGREPNGNVDFAYAAIALKRDEYSSTINQCAAILKQHPAALQVADLMCFAAAADGVSSSQRVESMRMSVSCQQEFGLIPPFAAEATPTDVGRRLASNLIERRPQLCPPNMNGRESIEKWLAHLLSGTDSGIPIRLEFVSRALRNSSHHFIRQENDKEIAVLYIREGTQAGFDETLLASAFFELLNLENWIRFRELEVGAINGSLARDQFVIQCAKLEHDAILKLRQFYVHCQLPVFDEYDIESDARNWRLATPGRFAAHLRNMPRDEWYPWKYYGETYQRLATYGFWNVSETTRWLGEKGSKSQSASETSRSGVHKKNRP